MRIADGLEQMLCTTVPQGCESVWLWLQPDWVDAADRSLLVGACYFWWEASTLVEHEWRPPSLGSVDWMPLLGLCPQALSGPPKPRAGHRSRGSGSWGGPTQHRLLRVWDSDGGATVDTVVAAVSGSCCRLPGGSRVGRHGSDRLGPAAGNPHVARLAAYGGAMEASGGTGAASWTPASATRGDKQTGRRGGQ
ncbi:hypothetical protein PLESTF_000407400 [Pleodorina starrii]|nr:hypothetical protein PLESTF_000407400 [Pleodorina starrii]